MEKGKVDIERIRRYVNGELPPREMYALERRAQDDPAWMDVLLGMEAEAQATHQHNLDTIRKRIAARTGRDRPRRLVAVQRWAIAASVLIALAVGVRWFTSGWHPSEQLPTVASVPVDVVPSPIDKEPVPERSQPEAPPTKESAPSSKSVVRVTATNETAPAIEERAHPTNDIVVVEFGKQKKSELVGAIAEPESLDTDSLVYGRAAQTTASLAGRTASVRTRDGMLLKEKPATVQGKVVDSGTQLLRKQETADPDSLVVTMKPMDTGLSEVVVVGYDQQKDRKAPSQPEPLEGWRSFNRYLKKGVRKANAGKGTVTVTFTVSDRGSATDIQLIHTTDTELSNQVMKLIHDGPKWKYGKNGERKAELTVKF